jgi:SAM-dependent methyltransferase
MSEPYTTDYYQAINNEERPQAIALADKIEELYNPSSIVDAGCGTGLYLAQFKAQDKLGFDYSIQAFDESVKQFDIIGGDLSQPMNLFRRFNVCLCLEVLEHIEEEHADTVVDNLSYLSDTLIVSAALPHQPGLNHVNCQPQSYWEEKFKLCGYSRNYLNEFWLCHAVSLVPHTLWIIRNLMVYERH